MPATEEPTSVSSLSEHVAKAQPKINASTRCDLNRPYGTSLGLDYLNSKRLTSS
jgi:hypothetical protein